MTDIQKNSGALFKNKRKTLAKQPDFTGKATINQIEYNLAGWEKKNESGETYVSLAIEIPNLAYQKKTNNTENDSPPPSSKNYGTPPAEQGGLSADDFSNLENLFNDQK